MKIIAHRGGAGLAEENTLAAIEKSLNAGVDEIEVDVRIANDGQPILRHDKHGHGAADSLESAIKLIDKKCPLIIEIKPGEAAEPVLELLSKFLSRGWEPRDFKIASFSLEILMASCLEIPAIQLIVLEKWSGVRATRRAKALGTRYIAMNQRWLWRGFIRQMSKAGYKLAAYTVNNPTQAKRWQRHGLHAVITDYPDRFSYN